MPIGVHLILIPGGKGKPCKGNEGRDAVGEVIQSIGSDGHTVAQRSNDSFCRRQNHISKQSEDSGLLSYLFPVFIFRFYFHTYAPFLI